MSDIQLHYFDTRGKAEFIRLLLTAAGEEFEDIRTPLVEWNEEKKKETLYGHLPILTYKGKRYGQSIAIATFFATKLGYYGQSLEDDLRQSEVIHLADDMILPHLRDWYYAEDKTEIEQNFRKEFFPRYQGYFERLLKENGSTGFFVGNSVSLADFCIYDILDTILGINPDALTSFPCQKKLRSNVEALPRIKEYLASRPKSII